MIKRLNIVHAHLLIIPYFFILGTDNLTPSSAISIKDNDDNILLTDQAGNTTEIKLQDKNRRIIMKAQIAAISYNGKPADISKNKFQFLWFYDKKGNLQLLAQNVQSFFS